MRQLPIVLMGIFYVFSSYTAESSNNSSKNRLKALLTVKTLVVGQKKSSSDSVTSPRLKDGFSSDSLISPYLFAPGNVLATLGKRIQAYSAAIKKGKGTELAVTRDDSLEFERYSLATDFSAVEKRYVSNGSVCAVLKAQYANNNLLFHNGEPLKIEDIVSVRFYALALKYGIPFATKEDRQAPELSARKPAYLYKLYRRVEQDGKLNPEEKQKWKDIFDLVLSEQAAENYRYYQVNCSFNDISFSMHDYARLIALKEQFNVRD